MLKKFFFLFLLIGMISSSCQKGPVVIIQGSFRNADKNSLSLEYLDINKIQVIDSTRLKKDGSFRFKISLDQPGLYLLRNNQDKIINLLVYPSEKIIIEGDYNEFDRDYSVNGSPDSEYIRQLVEKLNDTRNQLRELEEKYKNQSDITDNEANEFLVRRNEIIKEQRDFSISFIIDHLSSIASVYALYQKISPDQLVLSENRDIQYMKIVADTLSLKYPESAFVSTFVADARNAEKRFKNLIGMQKKIAQAQTGLPDISYPDTKGIMQSLYSLKGKTVLLYFWSAYSAETKTENIQYEKIYRKYKDRGFEIFAVNIDNDKNTWLKLVNFDELSYINVFAPDFADSETSRTYNLRSVPSTYLMDGSGNILARDLYSKDLEKWLDNVLR